MELERCHRQNVRDVSRLKDALTTSRMIQVKPGVPTATRTIRLFPKTAYVLVVQTTYYHVRSTAEHIVTCDVTSSYDKLRMLPESPSVFKVIPTTQQYDWGKLGSNSKVAQFAAASSLPAFSVNESLPYAEVRYHDDRLFRVTTYSCFDIIVMDGHTSKVSLSCSLNRQNSLRAPSEPSRSCGQTRHR
jgi:hypothetical protein